MTIAIDFDGTCVTHEYPNVGKEIGAAEVLQELIANGHHLILFTMRSDTEKAENEPNIPRGNYLTDAVNWFKKHHIPLWGIQTNPTQHSWTTSPKAYAHLYIDDAALGCPLTYDKAFGDRPFVDWVKVRLMLVAQGFIEE